MLPSPAPRPTRGGGLMDPIFRIVYYVPGMGRMECAVRESRLVPMLSALIGSGFHVESASIWRKTEDNKKTEAA